MKVNCPVHGPIEAKVIADGRGMCPACFEKIAASAPGLPDEAYFDAVDGMAEYLSKATKIPVAFFKLPNEQQ